MRIKKKNINSVVEEANNLYTSVSVVNHRNSLTRLYCLSLSVLLNILMIIVYMALLYYRISLRVVDILVFLISVVWAIISLVSSYILGDRAGNNMFYFNVILIYIMTKLWFILI